MTERGQALIFRWPGRQMPLLLPAFLGVSLLAHLLGFYLFQIVYPAPEAATPPPAFLTALNPSDPAHRSLLEWVEAEDPRAVATPEVVLPDALSSIPYRPSFAGVKSKILLPREKPDRVHFPALKPDAAVTRRLVLGNAPLPGTQVPELQPTQLAFSPELRPLAPEELPRLGFAAAAGEDLQPAEFTVGISGEGRALFIYRNSGSGDARLDEQAHQYLEALLFQPHRDEIRWGFATFRWGADVVTPEEQP